MTNRLHGLDILRFLMALSVLLFHFAFRGAAGGDMPALDLPFWLVSLSRYGYLGVSVFFMISGFVIAFSAEGRTPQEFAIARFARLYPTFILCMSLTFFVVMLGINPHFSPTFSDYIANFAMSARAFGHPFMDGSYWSIVVEVFLAFRFAQTVVISGIVLSRAIIRDMVPMEQAASLIGYVTMSMALLPMVGPIIGGALNDLFGWQANFITLLIAACLILVIMIMDLGETNKTKTANFRSQFAAWPELYQSKKFWGFSLTATFGAGAYYAFLGGAPFVGATLLHLSPSALGFQFAICTIGYIIGNFISGRYSTRFGINAMMITGGAVCTFGVLLTMGIESLGALTPLTFFGPLSFVGVGNGMALPSANAGIVSVRPHLAGSASGLGGFINFASNSALSVLAGSVLSIEAGAMPLLLVMLGTCVLSVLAPIYVWSLDRKETALQGSTNA